MSRSLYEDFVIGVDIIFDNSFTKYKELGDILKRKKSKRLSFSTYNYAFFQPQSILDCLKEDSFWSEVEYLKFDNCSLGVIIDIFILDLPKLEELKVSITNATGKYHRLPEIETLKVLKVSFNFEGNCADEIAKLLSAVPNVEKVTISIKTPVELKKFEIKNEKLKEIKIGCSQLENESLFMQQLIERMD